MQLVRHHAALLRAAGLIYKTAQHGFGFALVAERADVVAFAGPEIPKAGKAEKSVRALVAVHADIGQTGVILLIFLRAGTGAGVLHGRSLGLGLFLFSITDPIVDHSILE
jgi:hypothetical protein